MQMHLTKKLSHSFQNDLIITQIAIQAIQCISQYMKNKGLFSRSLYIIALNGRLYLSKWAVLGPLNFIQLYGLLVIITDKSQAGILVKPKALRLTSSSHLCWSRRPSGGEDCRTEKGLSFPEEKGHR